MEVKKLYPKIPEYSDLRINNIVYDEEHNIVNIEQISGDKMGMYTIVSFEDKKYPSNIYKIPLNEKWLVNFDFHYTEQGWYYKEFGDNHLTINIKTYQISLGSVKCIKEAWNIYLNKCCFVNDLQNLFFALTGTELKYK